MQIQVPGTAQIGLAGSLIDVSGFVMEKGMLQGMQDRAEGRYPPAYAEVLGIALWLLALAAGLVGAGTFVTRRDWRLPLAVGLLAVFVLFCLTFIQPVLWVRVVLVELYWQAPSGQPSGLAKPGRRTGRLCPGASGIKSSEASCIVANIPASC